MGPKVSSHGHSFPLPRILTGRQWECLSFLLEEYRSRMKVRYNKIRYTVILYNKIRYNVILYNKIRFNVIRYNKIRYNVIRYNKNRYSVIQYRK